MMTFHDMAKIFPTNFTNFPTSSTGHIAYRMYMHCMCNAGELVGTVVWNTLKGQFGDTASWSIAIYNTNPPKIWGIQINSYMYLQSVPFAYPAWLRWQYTKGHGHSVHTAFTIHSLLFCSTYDLCFNTMYIASCTTQWCSMQILLAYLLGGPYGIQKKTANLQCCNQKSLLGAFMAVELCGT